MRRYLLLTVVGSVLAFGSTACGDPTGGFFEPLVVSDTFTVGIPGVAPAGTPAALSITVALGAIEGPRFPERATDAGSWDFAVGVRDGQFVLLPPRTFGFTDRAGIIGPLPGRTLDDLREVPSGSTFVMDDPVPLEEGQVYVVRSREFTAGFGGCVQYGKFEVSEVNAETGIIEFIVATNGRCHDTRLVNAGG